MAKNNLSFPEALSWVADKLGLVKSKFNKKTRHPFGGFYKGIIREIEEPEYAMKTYDLDTLEEYSQKYNLLFFRDGITFQVQEKYSIGYDVCSNRITVPVWTLDNKLCGIMGRLNDTKCAHEERWLPIIKSYQV